VKGPVRQFTVRYGAAFWAYVLEPGEATLRALYELGRDAVASDLSTLDLAAIHHDVLGAALAQSGDPDESGYLVDAACDAFVETLSAYEMLARGFREAHDAARAERRQAAVVRRLSTFLTDTSLALEAEDSVAEVLRLVAEHARELLQASRCEAVLLDEEGAVSAAVHADADIVAHGGGTRGREERIGSDLQTLSGRRLGRLDVIRLDAEAFTDADRAVLVHLAQMTSGAVERSRLHRRSGARARER
jgi:Phosphoserine phosphatase RsbU, N-terminal domain